jgi:hypothetical protein
MSAIAVEAAVPVVIFQNAAELFQFVCRNKNIPVAETAQSGFRVNPVRQISPFYETEWNIFFFQQSFYLSDAGFMDQSLSGTGSVTYGILLEFSAGKIVYKRLKVMFFDIFRKQFYIGTIPKKDRPAEKIKKS